MRSRLLAVDVGGTFTDCISVERDGRRVVGKAPTTPLSLDDGVMDALGSVARRAGISRRRLLAETERFVHGTTQATNTLITRSGARTGFITTKGHEDTLIIGRAYSKVAGLDERELVHASRLRKPAPIVPRRYTRGVTERVDRTGAVVVDLDEEEVVAAIDELLGGGVEAIAVSLLWSFLDDSHERRIAELIAARDPGVFVSCSHRMAPLLGEYERAATTAVAAYVGPSVAAYLGELERRLHSEGLAHPVSVIQANGGVTSVLHAAERPILTLDSGPTGGILGCAGLAATYGEDDVICTDVGGTTFDVGVILAGELPLTESPVVDRYAVKLPKVDVAAIGAGGGSIAWLDEAGLLQVGPSSAGSLPGPACYGRGGSAATVSDADLVLGYLDVGFFLGGEMTLDKDLALRALGTLARKMGLETEEVAAGIFRIVNAQMADLISKVTLARGSDPRRCVLVAYGGAGPTHAAFYGADLGVKEILVPAESTVFSAEGMLSCDVVHAESRSRRLVAPFGGDDLAQLSADLDELEARVIGRFEAEGAGVEGVEVGRSVGMRFRNQMISLDVEVPAGDLDGPAADELLDRFHRRYLGRYGEGSMLRDGAVEIDLHKVTGVRRIEAVPFPEHEAGEADAAEAQIGSRPAFFESAGFTEVDVYDGDLLLPGYRIAGPAIIQRLADTVVVPPWCDATVDTRLTLRLMPSSIDAVGTPFATATGL